MRMHKVFFLTLVFLSLFLLASITTEAQCSICTRTAQQLGEKPAKGLNAGILYLAFTPLLLIGYLGFKWWKKNNSDV
jgi:hypothetical protein